MQKLLKHKILILLLVALAFRLVISFFGYHNDLLNHTDWGIRFWQYGPAKFYSANVWSFTWPNQPPGSIYMFAGTRKLYEGIFGLFSYLHFQLHIFPGSILLYLEKNLYSVMVKLPSVLADLGIAWLIYKVVYELTKKNKLSVVAMAVWLFNPVSWYNSAVWGQSDAVINFLAFLAFYLLVRKKLLWAVFLFASSLYIKASLLIFGPVFLVAALRQNYSISSWIKSVLVTLLAIGIFTLPFAGGEPFSWLFNLYVDKIFVDQLHSITANAFNLWGAIKGISATPELFPDSAHFLGLTYQIWGFILFAIFYIPSLWIVYKKQSMESVVWSCAVAAFASFMLLTNMHERYLYPLFPYFTVLLIANMNLVFNYIAVSLIHFLNLYNFWWFPSIPGLKDFMTARAGLFPRFLSGIAFMLFTFFYFRFVKYGFYPKLNEKSN